MSSERQVYHQLSDLKNSIAMIAMISINRIGVTRCGFYVHISNCIVKLKKIERSVRKQLIAAR